MRDAEFVKIAKALADATRHRMLLELRAAGELTCSVSRDQRG
jgi:DNA-binding transcriptional ArsR family regulator